MSAAAVPGGRLARLQRLLNPATVAVAGGEVAAEVIRQCRAVGFGGQLWAINPHRASIEGVPSFPDVDALPAAPDATYVAVRREETVKLVAALSRRGAAGAVCYASGFAEVGGEGVGLQQALVQAAGDMALLGPNCYGAVNYLDGCALWPDRQGGRRVDRGVAILTQSGNIALNLSMQRHHLPLAYLLAIGNKAVSDVHDCMAALLCDERVTAIGLHLEGLTDVAAFSRVARAALARGVGVVVLKSGVSEIGAELTASHTRSLSGPEELYQALFDRLGIARAGDLAELLETLKLLHACGALPGRRVGSLSCSGGDASMMADIGQERGLEFPRLDAAVVESLSATLGPRVPINNPLDYQTYIWGNRPALRACFSAMMGAHVDLCAIVLDFPHHGPTESVDGWQDVLDAFEAACQGQRVPAVMVSSMPELMPAHVAERLLAAGIAPMQGLRECAAAIAAAARIGAARRSAEAVAPLPGPVALAQGPVAMLDELAAKTALARFGLRVPSGGLVRDGAEAVEMAEAIGYPVVVKAVSEALAHKTELGAVRLNLAAAPQVRAAVSDLGRRFDRFLLEKMVTDGLAELIVGVTRNAQFGLALTIGAGGIWVEVLSDAATLLLPASRADIERALRGLRCFALLDGHRGRPPADLGRAVDAIAAVAAFAEANADRLVELDVNPLIVSARDAVAVDALVRLCGAAPPRGP
ncbi:MAG TPA: acetate--CoA ligase family protein [Burkholderiaceae bacterium]|nr:acetate--CoA ligase family protein [Burkholderiaceae bacterium]